MTTPSKGLIRTMTSSAFAGARDRLETASGPVEVVRLDRLGIDLGGLPQTVLILLENLLRRAGSRDVSDDDVKALAAGPPRLPISPSCPAGS